MVRTTVGEALGPARVDLRHLSVGVNPGAGRGAGADREGRGIREQIQARSGPTTRRSRLLPRTPSVELLAAEGGWSAVVRVPSTRSEEELVIALLDERDVLVHPGFFFDFPHEAYLVVSLLPEPAVFADGVARIMEQSMSERSLAGRRAGVLVPLFSIPTSRAGGSARSPICRSSRRGCARPASRSCSCCRSTRWRRGRARRIRR